MNGTQLIHTIQESTKLTFQIILRSRRLQQSSPRGVSSPRSWEGAWPWVALFLIPDPTWRPDHDGEINLTVPIDYEYHLKWKLSMVWVDDPESTNGTILSSDKWSHLDQTPVFSDTAFIVIIKENWGSCNIANITTEI